MPHASGAWLLAVAILTTGLPVWPAAGTIDRRSWPPPPPLARPTTDDRPDPSATPRDPAAAQPLVSIDVDSASGFRPTLVIGPVLDNESLREAVASGIPIRVHIRVELWRDGFFDDLDGSESWSTVILYEPLAERFIVRAPDTRGTALRYETYEGARAAVEGRRTLALRPRRTGNHYYTATLVLETLSLSDLEELQRWLQGELQPAVSGGRSLAGALGEGARRLAVRLLRLPDRRLEARSPRFNVRSLPDDPDSP